MRPAAKVLAIEMFLKGQSVADVAAFFAVTRPTIERLLREAVKGLAALKVPSTEVAETV